MKNTKKSQKRYATTLRTPDGGKLWVSGKTKEEFEKKVLEARLAISSGVILKNDLDFKSYALSWLNTYKKPPKVKMNTYLGYSQGINRVLPILGDVPLQGIKPSHIQAVLTHLMKFSYGTQKQTFMVLNMIFDSAVDNDLLTKTPIKSTDHVTDSKVKRGKPVAANESEQVLTEEQCRILLDAVRGKALYFFCLFALSTGMRRGEILGLMWDDVDLKNAVIHVRHMSVSKPSNGQPFEITDDLKTPSAYRNIPIPGPLLTELKAQRLKNPTPYVFVSRSGVPYSYNAFGSYFTHVMRDCLPFPVHPHLLRHTYITQLFEAGTLDLKQIQYLAGHASPDITLKIYTHYRKDSREQETHDKVVDALTYLAM